MSRVLIVTMLTSMFSAQAASINSEDKVRQPAVAGAFYPADPAELGRMIDGFLAKANPPDIKDLVAIVAPHAGYIYSGGVAANSYAAQRPEDRARGGDRAIALRHVRFRLRV